MEGKMSECAYVTDIYSFKNRQSTNRPLVSFRPFLPRFLTWVSGPMAGGGGPRTSSSSSLTSSPSSTPIVAVVVATLPPFLPFRAVVVVL